MNIPNRIQRRRIKGWRKPHNTLNATRPGRHGNPYTMIGGEFGRDDSLLSFRVYLDVMERDRPEEYKHLIDDIKNADYVMCWCPLDRPCHVDEWIRRTESEMK